MNLSFIIPVYNAESYIKRCLTSIIPVLSPEIEAIIVDDGSTDNTPSILHELSQKYPHLQVIRQENQGQSVARNVGLEMASGEYIWFLDADDYIDISHLQLLIDTIQTRRNDLIVIGRIEEYGQTSKQTQHLWEATYDTGLEYFQHTIQKGAYRTQPWDKIVKRSLLIQNHIYFEPHRMFEDMIHGLQIVIESQKTRLLPIYPYHYVLYNPGSLTKQVRANDLDALYFTENAYQLLQKKHLSSSPTIHAFLTLVFSFLTSCLLKKYIPLAPNNQEAQDIIDAVMRHPIFLQATRYCATHWVGIRRTAMAQIICLSPRLYQFILQKIL